MHLLRSFSGAMALLGALSNPAPGQLPIDGEEKSRGGPTLRDVLTVPAVTGYEQELLDMLRWPARALP